MYEGQIYKEALNAQKSREVAKEVGLIPEGQWKWALRHLKDDKGNPLKGKELADAKHALGAVSNNAYQGIKSQSRKLGSDTEIGGALLSNNNKTNPIGVVAGKKGTGSVGLGGANLMSPRVFHTHPSTDRILALNDTKKYLSKFTNAKKTLGDDINPKDVVSANHSINENFKRFSKKKNSLLTDMSGAITANNGKNLTKKEVEHLVDLAQKSQKDFQDSVDYKVRKGYYMSSPSSYKDLSDSDKTLFRRLMKNKTQASLLTEDMAGGDYGVEKRRIDLYKKPHQNFMHNIIAPEQDIEAIHKVTNPGRKRSIYFDRSPRKAK